ncbi:MAG: M15 family metallopeptidase [Acidimicrobiales bacterium]
MTTPSTTVLDTNSTTVETEGSTASTTTSSTTAPSTAAPSTTVASSSSSSAPTTTDASPPAAPAETVLAEPPPAYTSLVRTVDDATAARMAASWREGCPVGLADLRLVEVDHWNFAGTISRGELVVHADHAHGIASVFALLYDVGFAIERMELVDEYDADDDLSMAANNTSAFNCREVAWKPGVWSNHAFGTAIDVNPLVNPYVSGSTVLPPEGAAFADRSTSFTGGIFPGDDVVAAFASIGWGWGGDWSGAKDWQHFSASGT